MQLGFVTAIFGDLKLEEVLKHASQIGYDCVEVMCWPPGTSDREYGGVCHLNCTDFSQAQADDTRALCEKYGVSISASGASCSCSCGWWRSARRLQSAT